jgi:hypothetical protein
MREQAAAITGYITSTRAEYSYAIEQRGRPRRAEGPPPPVPPLTSPSSQKEVKITTDRCAFFLFFIFIFIFFFCGSEDVVEPIYVLERFCVNQLMVDRSRVPRQRSLESQGEK